MRFVLLEGGGEARAQPLARGVHYENPRRSRRYMDFAGIEEEQTVVALLQDDDRIGMRLDAVFGHEVAEDDAAESPLTKS